jgi:hypothetical protein
VARGRRSRLAAICQRRLDQHSMKSILPVSPQKRGYLVKRNYEEPIELARMCACDSRDGPEVVDEPRRWQRNIRPKPLSQGFIRAAPPFPQHNSASFGGLAYRRCRVLGEVPMSKVPIFASFDFAEILMLTASILVIAAIAFVF